MHGSFLEERFHPIPLQKGLTCSWPNLQDTSREILDLPLWKGVLGLEEKEAISGPKDLPSTWGGVGRSYLLDFHVFVDWP